MNIFRTLFIIGCAFIPTLLMAQETIDARSAGMGFSNGADTRGLEQVGLNPATLALQNSYNFEFNLLSFNASVNNNSFNKNQYEQYFASGDVLTAQDVQDILDLIPDSGLRANALLKLNTLALYTRNLSISFAGLGGSSVNAPKDFLELPLTGNREPGRVYRLDDIDGSGWVGLGILLGASLPINTDNWENISFFSVGATLKYIIGFANFEVLKASGELRDFDLDRGINYINLNGEMELMTSEGGKGFGADLGTLITYREKLTLGLTLVNLLGSITWDKNVERHVFSLFGDSLSLPDNVPDSIFTESTFSEDSYSTRMPFLINLSAAYHWRPDLIVTSALEKGFSKNLGGSKKVRLAVGMEYTRLPFLPLRTGLSFGGRGGFSFALGAGLNLKYWILDFAYINHGGLFPGSSKGLTLAATTRFRF